MANDYFKFKRFTIFQSQCALKVGTDGVLLGLWARGNRANSILDIGCGSGIITLILAQRFENSKVTGVEISESCANQAKSNVEGSPFFQQITIVNKKIQDFNQGTFDIIVSNPPYFENSLLSTKSEKDRARHTLTLTNTDLLRAVSRLLNPKGVFNVVLPTTSVDDFVNLAESDFSLFVNTQTTFQHSSLKPPKRALLQLERIKKPLKKEALILFDNSGNPTTSFLKMGSDFYLNF